MDREFKVGDLVWTDETEEGFKPTYGVIVWMEKVDDECNVWDLDVMVNDVGYGNIEEWCISEPEWDEEVGAWTFYWN